MLYLGPSVLAAGFPHMALAFVGVGLPSCCHTDQTRLPGSQFAAGGLCIMKTVPLQQSLAVG